MSHTPRHPQKRRPLTPAREAVPLMSLGERNSIEEMSSALRLRIKAETGIAFNALLSHTKNMGKDNGGDELPEVVAQEVMTLMKTHMPTLKLNGLMGEPEAQPPVAADGDVVDATGISPRALAIVVANILNQAVRLGDTNKLREIVDVTPGDDA